MAGNGIDNSQCCVTILQADLSAGSEPEAKESRVKDQGGGKVDFQDSSLQGPRQHVITLIIIPLSRHKAVLCVLGCCAVSPTVGLPYSLREQRSFADVSGANPSYGT